MSSNKFQIKVSGITVEITKKDIRNIHLKVLPPDGRVRLSSPKHIAAESLRQFIISKLGWIKKNVQKINSREREPERKYLQGETHYVQGRPHTLNIIEENRAPKILIRKNGDEKYLDLYVRPGSDRSKREKVLREWYRDLLKDQIPALITKWEAELGVSVRDWGVKRMKTRWGTCNIKAGRIWLNLELAKRPSRLLEYVVLHEMVHLKERLHNNRFRAFMDLHMQDWRERQKELNSAVY